MTYESILAAMKALTKAQFRALGSIYCGNDGGMGFNKKTLAALVSKGLVDQQDRQLGGGRFVVTIRAYVCPSIPRHMAWCSLCPGGEE